jgi:hypothetical protein
MYELVMLMCVWNTETLSDPRRSVLCKERVLVITDSLAGCERFDDTVKTDGRGVVIYCRPRTQPQQVERK